MIRTRLGSAASVARNEQRQQQHQPAQQAPELMDWQPTHCWQCVIPVSVQIAFAVAQMAMVLGSFWGSARNHQISVPRLHFRRPPGAQKSSRYSFNPLATDAQLTRQYVPGYAPPSSRMFCPVR